MHLAAMVWTNRSPLDAQIRRFIRPNRSLDELMWLLYGKSLKPIVTNNQGIKCPETLMHAASFLLYDVLLPAYYYHCSSGSTSILLQG